MSFDDYEDKDEFYDRQASIIECVSLLEGAYDSMKEYRDLEFKDLADEIWFLLRSAKGIEKEYKVERIGG